VNYRRWTVGKEIAGRLSNRRLVDTEIDESGRVSREVGVDGDGSVVYRAPSTSDRYGLFDNQVIEIVEPRNEITPEAFEQLWQSASE
jgi:hypothetical protein